VSNRELESYSYAVSHDLRAPLRAINGFSRLIEDEYAMQLDERGKNYLGRVRAGAERMSTLIDDLLKLSQISRRAMQNAPVDLSALARDIVEELHTAEAARAVEWTIASGLATRGDPGLMRIAIQNLLANAWKYSSKRATAHIEFGSTEKEGRKIYFVRDDGAGFDMAYVGKMFQAFQRLHPAEAFPGSGIGLATVARVIHRHGGEVWAEGRENEGATFYFTVG
jgi:light-regulated signal transduction histidine kinase (bacteriophytochrome)